VKAKAIAPVAVAALVILVGCAKVDPTSDKAACQMDVMREGKDWSTDRRLRFVALCMKTKGWEPSSSCLEKGIEGTDACQYVRP